MSLYLDVSLQRQRLSVMEDGHCLREYPVSTALKGAGEREGSYCTPRGKHAIRLKIGTNMPINTVFVGRRPSGEIYTDELGEREPGRDWILTRILWLSGQEKGFNRGGERDSLRRFIYIHGTNEEHLIGQAASHGCVRMKNQDILELFDLVEQGTLVFIHDDEGTSD